jgi:TetR/AcrR family transcriptional regulator, ethionamide resistance regulator
MLSHYLSLSTLGNVTTPLRSRRRQSREQTRRQIVEAAEAFLRSRPLAELTVEELMALTGHSRTVFYRHFGDLADVVVAVLAEAGAGLQRVGEEWAQADGDPRAIAEEHLAGVVAFWVRNGPLMAAISAAARTDSDIEAAYFAFGRRFVELTAATLRAEMEAGRIAPLDVDEVAVALTLMNEAYLLQRLGREPQADPERVLAVLRTMWTRVLSPAG